MKKLRSIFLCLTVIFFMTSPYVQASEEQNINDIILSNHYTVKHDFKVPQTTDSIGIFHLPNGPYYIFCSTGPINTKDGFILLEILDTLNYIDPGIPREEWLNAYLSGNYSYKWTPERSVIKFEKWEFQLDNYRNDTRAVLLGDRIESVMLTNIARNDKIDSTKNGKIMIIVLFMLGLFLGLLINNLNQYKIITTVVLMSIAAILIYIMFDGTLLALSIPLAAMITGIIIPLTVFSVFHSFKKNKQS